MQKKRMEFEEKLSIEIVQILSEFFLHAQKIKIKFNFFFVKRKQRNTLI